jgi:hypothetical protein
MKIIRPKTTSLAVLWRVNVVDEYIYSFGGKDDSLEIMEIGNA